MKIRMQLLENTAEKHYALLVSEEQLAAITNDLEETSIRCAEGSGEQLLRDDMIMEITKVTGY